MIGHTYTVVTHCPAQEHVAQDSTHGESASEVLQRWISGYSSGYEAVGVLELRVSNDADPRDFAEATVEIYEDEGGTVRWRAVAEVEVAA